MDVLQPDEPAAVVRLDAWWWSLFSFHTNLPHPSPLQHTPLNAPGIYIRTLIPDGPAASDGRLKIGDRILAVNGTSLIGADYQRYGWGERLTVLLGEIDCNGWACVAVKSWFNHTAGLLSYWDWLTSQYDAAPSSPPSLLSPV